MEVDACPPLGYNLYFDNGAMAHPKAPGMRGRMEEYLQLGGTYGRGAYLRVLESSRLVEQCRRRIAAMIGVSKPRYISFTHNATSALNTVIQGFPYRRRHVWVSALEHNAVMRPLEILSAREGLEYTVLPSQADGRVELSALGGIDFSQSDYVAICHASNVNGVVQDIASIRRAIGDIPMLVDASQSVGYVPVRAEEWDVDFLAFSGHKGLAGPTGVGVLYLQGRRVEISPLSYGGGASGGRRVDGVIPLPDRYEAGTPNMIGIAGLLGALEEPLVAAHSVWDFLALLGEMSQVPGVGVYHGWGGEGRGLELFSLRPYGMELSELTRRLHGEYGIEIRSGMHCAPLAHRSLGTGEVGTARFSLSPAHSPEDLDYLLQALKSILS